MMFTNSGESPRNTKTTAQDLTARFLPELIDKNDPTIIRKEAEVFQSPEDQKKFYEMLSQLWNGLRQEIFIQTDNQTLIPEFQPQMIQIVQFLNGDNVASYDPLSGVINLSYRLYEPHKIQKLAPFLAHEMVHLASQNKLLNRTNSSGETATKIVRSGLTLVRDSLIGSASPGKQTERGWAEGLASVEDLSQASLGLSILDEPVEEILSKKILTEVAKKLPLLEKKLYSPNVYEKARAFYANLVANLVLAWNRPEFRSTKKYTSLSRQPGAVAGREVRNSDEWRNRAERLTQELGFGQRIQAADVEKLFEQALWKKSGISPIAQLMNTMLGEGAFQELLYLSDKINPQTMEGTNSMEVWQIISEPTRLQNQANRS